MPNSENSAHGSPAENRGEHYQNSQLDAPAQQLHYLQARKRRTPQYEYRTVVVPRGLPRGYALGLLTLEAETGKWELSRTVIYQGGVTKYWLRRKIILVHED